MNDAVSRMFAVAAARGGPRTAAVEDLLEALDALDSEALAAFDDRARASWHRAEPPPRALPHRRVAARRLRGVLDLVSPSGFDRERAVAEVEIHRSTAALLLVRTTDWVDEVRAAALRRVESDVAPPLLAELLPLADRVARARSRGRELDAILDARLDREILLAAARSPDPRTRRAAWRRLLDRGLAIPRDLRGAGLADGDVRVRALAVRLLAELTPPERRAAGEWLVGDPVGWLAARGLELLVEADGEAAIPPALTSDRATLRRHARGWAAVRGVDAATVYRERLAYDPGHAASLIGLAELAAPQDGPRLREALDDRRAAVRAAALRAMAAIDPVVAREAALHELEQGGTGRAGRAAARVLRDAALSEADLQRLETIALDDRPDAVRLRALTLLRPSRWRHLATTLELHARAEGPLLDRVDGELGAWARRNARAATGPAEEQRAAIARRLHGLPPDQRQQIEFILRTTSEPPSP